MLDAVFCFVFFSYFIQYKECNKSKVQNCEAISNLYKKKVYSTGMADTFCQIRNTKEKNIFQNIKLNDILKSTKVLQCCFSSISKNFSSTVFKEYGK